ncbi:DNA polymerase III subunit delta' [Pseudogracilibacillus sp. SE30717A]|uniref:DNA polymerase III subunit delta' n=1 Tax=Pseudogracilibacillus sp. SE30717A TaxID=3098293 RepID=UPI00300E0F1D
MQTWAELSKVQPLASKIMINSFQKNRVSHAYLIQGSRGTGKKQLANLIAMTLFCENKNDLEPCQNCHMCKRVLSRNHPDVHWVEPDGKSIKNEQIEMLRKEFSYTGMESSKKIYIIHPAESLTVNAANRILKFLEEPTIEITALLLTDNGHGILPTIRSRCQQIDLKPLDEKMFQKKLMNVEGLLINENNARLLSALTNNIDEAIELHKEEKIYRFRDIIEQFIYMLISNYEQRYLFIHQKWIPEMKDKQDQELGLDLMLLAFRDIANTQIGRSSPTFFFQPTDGLLTRAVHQFTEKRLLQILKTLLETKQKMNQNVHQTLVMEQLVLQI